MFADRPAVLFDLDGTLIDSVGDLAAAVNHVLATAALPALSRDEVMRFLGDGAPVLLARAFARYDAEPPPDAPDRLKAHYRVHCLDTTRPYPGIVDLLGRLAAVGRTVAVVTNKPTAFAEQMVAGLGLESLVAAVVGPEQVARRKPAPEHVLGTLERLGHKAGEAVMIGDGTTDVEAGRRAATATVAVLWGYRSRADLAACGPDRMVETVSELTELLVAG